jgi:hypothetical protein
VSVEAFALLAEPIIRATPRLSNRTNERRFRSMFGVPIEVVPALWLSCCEDERGVQGGKPRHLLWALLFLKLYSCEHVSAAMCRCDEKTYRKWAWIYVDKLADLKLVSS